MPFKKTNAGSKDARSLAEARKVFIGRTSELLFFIQHVLEPEDPTYHIISISGQGGVGKSTLLSRFIEETQGGDFKDYCLTALVNERQTTPANIMEKFAEQLSLKGDFEKALSQYKETLRRVQSEREAAREALLRQATTDVVGSLAKTVPVMGGVLETVAGSTIEYIWEELHSRQRLKDAERLEDPIGDLTRNFVKELNQVADASVTVGLNRIRRQKRVVLSFDTFEQLATEANPWLLDYFLEANISSNVVLVVAGRESIDRSTPDDPKRWLPYHDENELHLISLEHFTQDETRTYLAERGITDPTQVDTYWQLSRGLPLYLGFLQGDVDPTKDVVDNFLRWIPKQEQVKQRLALDAACFSRPFNQDDLVAFSYVPEQERPQLYLCLTGQPFVRSSPEDGRYIYHELARDLFCRYLYQRSPEDCSATRRALTEYYQRLLNKKVKAEGKDVYESAQWLELTLALAHQLFLLADEGSHTQAVEQILDAYDHAGQTGEILRLLRDLAQGSAHSQVSARMQQSAKQLLKYIELQYSEDEGAPQGFLAAVQYLLEQVANERSCSTELVASLYYQRGVAYERLKQDQRAIADYIQAITLNPKVAVYYGYRGNAYHGLLPPRAQKIFRDIAAENSEAAPRATVMLGQLLEEQDDLEGAKAFYQRALDSGDSEAVPRAAAALGLLLQLQGDLEGAKAFYQRALDSGHPDWAPRATVILGQLLEEQGDLVHLPGAAELEAFITMNGDNSVHDDTVRRRVVEAQVLALGAPAQGASGTAHLLHCTVPVGDTTIAMLPVFTRLEHVVDAVQMNPAWQMLQVLQMEGSVVSGDLEEEEWLGINPWSGHEFKLPAISSTNPGLVKKPGQNAYAELKQFDHTLADFSRAIDLDSNNPPAYYTLKRYERAVADYSRVIELVPHSVEYHRWRGNAYAELKQFDQALADFSRAIDLDPNNVLAYMARGHTYYTLKEYERAVADYSRVIDLIPHSVEYHRWRGNAYAELKQFDQALADYSRAIDLDPHNARNYMARGHTYYDLKEYERAVGDLSRAIDLDPNNRLAYNNRGFTYCKLKEYERAVGDLSRAIDLDPAYKVAYTNRGRVYLWQRNIAQAKADFARAVEIDPTYPLAALLVEWSSLSKQRGGIDMAERFEEIASIKPQESQEYIVLVCQAIALELRNKLEESLEEIDKAITLMPEKEIPYFWKGILSAYHTTPSDAKDAIESIQQALVLGLPPILLTPLYWLEHDRPDWFSQYARPLLDQYGV